MAVRKKKTDSPVPFQMAPMIDMVFLLLVFFMCVSNMSQAESGKEIELAKSDTSTASEDLSFRLQVTVDENNDLFIGPRPTTIESLTKIISEEIKQYPSLKVQIRATQNTTYSEIKKILKCCAQAGAADIVYSTYSIDG